MRDFDWDAIKRGKDLYRARLASLPLEQKLQRLEQLRARTIALRGSSSAARVEPSSNIRVLTNVPRDSPSGTMVVAGGAINLGVFGVNASLVAPATVTATRPHSSAGGNAALAITSSRIK